MKSENQASNEIRTACNTGGTRAWRNNSGRALIHGSWVNFGIPGTGGGSDLIGLHSLTITPDMVGRKVAVFLAIEAKSSTGKPTADQVKFIDFVQSMGGIAGVARGAEDALSLINQYTSCHTKSPDA